jgi:hypothetical protein
MARTLMPCTGGHGRRQAGWVTIIIIVIMAPGLAPGWTPDALQSLLTILLPVLVIGMIVDGGRGTATAR